MAQLHRYAPADTSKSPAPTVEQLLRGGEASKGSPSSSSSERSKHWDAHEDHSHHHKKSVLTKVKEKAKKLRHSLSKKKHDDNVIPSPVEDEDDDDTEYLGAPSNVISSSSERSKHWDAHEDHSHHHKKSVLTKVKEKAKKLRHSLSKKKHDDNVIPSPVEDEDDDDTEYLGAPTTPSAPTTSRKVSSAVSSPKTPRSKAASKASYDPSTPRHASSAPVTPQASARNGYSDHIWDKGVSVKEYLMNKFEPGEDDRALSEVISEAMSPKTAPEDKGVMEKFRDAVTSLLRNDEPSQSTAQTPVTQTSSEIPVSTNAYEVGQEEDHGRILQAN
ncbi:low-temperature-induced 65 kDa protein-like [Neltuma alba]|uniref:low-temperature-induced 65 kDa protein-like n=1 Tax=Neltuma alba TaxID=207710 RepID=UPI0010A2E397|nr:low-temperature-induced 65 kDa protein-like [Prosopis alba]